MDTTNRLLEPTCWQSRGLLLPTGISHVKLTPAYDRDTTTTILLSQATFSEAYRRRSQRSTRRRLLPILPAPQDGVPYDASADEQGGCGQEYRPDRHTAALGEILLHHLGLFLHYRCSRVRLCHGGRHEDQHSHHGGGA